MASLPVENVAAAAPAWLRGFLAFAAAKWAGSRLVGSAAGVRAPARALPGALAAAATPLVALAAAGLALPLVLGAEAGGGSH
jgi:hypothetical protein